MQADRFPARIRPLAADDLEQIVRYLDARSDQAGNLFRDEILRTVALLSEHPGMGTLRRTRGRLKGLRSWPMSRFDSYLVFYLPIPGGIEVVRVLHGARNVDRELRK